jgi:tail sheath protein
LAGSFSKSIRPKLAGAYFNWEAEAEEGVEANIGGIVALPLWHNWGPFKVSTIANSWAEWVSIFGSSDTAGSRAAYQAFKGQGFGGRGGAGAVLTYRMGTAAALAASRTLQNTTPANALTLTARYVGTRGNDFRVTVQAAAEAGRKELLILDGTRVLEKYIHAETDMNALAAEINLLSDWVSATVVLSGVALANVASQALTGGNDGSALTGTEWSAAMTAFEATRFSVFVPFDLTDATIRTSVDTWQQTLNDRGKRVMTVLGSALADTMSAAATVATGINDPNVVYAAGFQAKALDIVGDPTLSPSAFAPRIAGAIAFLGEARDVIYTRFADVELVSGASIADEELALDRGITTMTKDTHATAPAFIREGVTTYSDDSASPVDSNGVKTRPTALYKRIKNLRIQHAVELEVDEWATSGGVLGELPVNDRARGIVIGHIEEILDRRVTGEIIQPGFTVKLDQDPPADDDQDFVQLIWGFHPTRSFRQMFSTVRLG